MATILLAYKLKTTNAERSAFPVTEFPLAYVEVDPTTEQTILRTSLPADANCVEILALGEAIYYAKDSNSTATAGQRGAIPVGTSRFFLLNGETQFKVKSV